MCRDVERFDRNRHDMDALAPVLAEMAYMSGDIDRRVNRMNERIEREAAVRAVARAGQPPDQEAVEQVAQQAGFRRNIKRLQVSRVGRTDERRVGEGWGSPCSQWWRRVH